MLKKFRLGLCAVGGKKTVKRYLNSKMNVMLYELRMNRERERVINRPTIMWRTHDIYIYKRQVLYSTVEVLHGIANSMNLIPVQVEFLWNCKTFSILVLVLLN